MSTIPTTFSVERAEPLPASRAAEGAGRPAAALREVQELWLSIAGAPWRSLAIVPAGSRPGATPAKLARALADAADALGGGPVTVLSPAAGAALALAAPAAPRDGRTLVPIAQVVAEPAGAALAQRADAVLLCVERGRTRLADVRRTVALVGRARILGCVLVRAR